MQMLGLVKTDVIQMKIEIAILITSTIVTFQMKGIAAHQMGAVTDATKSLSKDLQKSIKTCSKEANRFARSLGEIVDVEDILKSIHKATNPDEYEDRKSSVIHKPIDWSKHPPSSQRKLSKECSMTTEEECEYEYEKANEEYSTSKRNCTSSDIAATPSDDHQKNKGLPKSRVLGANVTKTNRGVPSHSPRMYKKKFMR